MENIEFLSNSVLVLSLALLTLRQKTGPIKKKRRPRSLYMRAFYQQRRAKTEHKILVEDLREMDPELHYEHFRMTKNRYMHLLGLIEKDITHPRTHAVPITPDERLGLTLSILAEGMSQSSVARRYRMSKSAVNVIFRETCQAIWENLRHTYVPSPTQDTWLKSAKRFWDKWQFPNCIGAIDGKHIEITAPYNSGSKYFNYKEYFSIVLLACVDADYCFDCVDIEGYGRQSDGGTLAASELGKGLDDGSLPIPPPCALPGTDQLMPHMFVADAAFPMRENLMRPYPERNLNHGHRIFNYRLSRARRIVENAFGILTHRWRILLGPMQCEPTTADVVVKATVALHNYLIKTETTAAITDRRYNPPGYSDAVLPDGEIADGAWRTGGTSSLFRQTNASDMRAPNRCADTPLKNRDRLRDYFLSPIGQVAWQNRMAYT